MKDFAHAMVVWISLIGMLLVVIDMSNRFTAYSKATDKLTVRVREQDEEIKMLQAQVDDLIDLHAGKKK